MGTEREDVFRDVVTNWLKKFDQQQLNLADFHQFWGRHVPQYYSPKLDADCLNLTYDEVQGNNLLFLSLEQFITGSADPPSILNQLTLHHKPAALCGRVFKNGEATYYCRDCGMDATCVLCVDCFKKSPHKSHRYKMNTSGGGGICDCGDEGAWKQHPFCLIHQHPKSISQEAEDDPLKCIPNDIASRANLVFEGVLNYCDELLTMEIPLTLPKNLKAPLPRPDTFTTVLFNDEIHTYDQVITTLSRALNCTAKQALEYATMIDREGRSIVRVSTEASCKQLGDSIEKISTRHSSRSLRILIYHVDVIAYQNFALKLLSWIQRFLSNSEGFRFIFRDVIMKPTDYPLLESVMLGDMLLWKAARNQWHQLFIASMYMEKELKKTFAKVFTRNYHNLMKDFIADDHDHSFSITSMSVQIFTMPLSLILVEEEDALAIVLHTFLSQCSPYVNNLGKLSFERNQYNSTFRRAHYILHDLKYLLTVKPKEWNENMREKFVNGVQSFLKLLTLMQGMDSVVRQVGQHVEYEAEWETGVNLQLKLSSAISLILEWCCADSTVFEKVLDLSLDSLSIPHTQLKYVQAEVCGHVAKCIAYDVSALPVTIHIPLSRFVASLLHLERAIYHAPPSFTDDEDAPTVVQLLELHLRTLVLVSQFRAGMWHRNGYSLLNQVFFYQNVSFRDQMFDVDILMLQYVASLMDGNSFLLHLLNRYKILQWAKDDAAEEDANSSFVSTLAEEFLSLVIYVVSERYILGIGKVEGAAKIKKEIIQLLCIEPMPHSQLFKRLPKDVNYETGMDVVINEVADFKQVNSKGKYELKAAYYKEFNPYFYHYSREDQSKAVESQIRRRRQNGEEECCPPPLLVEFCPDYAPIVNILQCDVLIHIVKQTLQRALSPNPSSHYSEMQFEKAVYLIGTALQEEARYLEKDKQASSTFRFTEKALARNLFEDLEKCLGCHKLENQKDLLRWVLKKYKTLEAQRAKNKDASESSSSKEDISSMEVSEVSEREKLRRKNAALAAARRERIMSQMAAMQKSFMTENEELLKSVVSDKDVSLDDSMSMIAKDDDPVAVGHNQRGKVCASSRQTCILCRDEQEVSAANPSLVLAAFVQRSTVLSKNRSHTIEALRSSDPLLFHADLCFGPHVSTCGHVMHSSCWQHFFDSVLIKERRRPIRYGRNTSYDVDNNEFLCPLCERLSNSVIPLIPPLNGISSQAIPPPIPFDNYLHILKKVAEHLESSELGIKRLVEEGEGGMAKKTRNDGMPTLAEFVRDDVTLENLRDLLIPPGPSIESTPYHDTLIKMIALFSHVTFSVGFGIERSPQYDPRVSLMAWQSCIFTILSMEWNLRDLNKPVFGDLSSRQEHCLEAVVKFAASSVRIFEKALIRNHATRLILYLFSPDYYKSNESPSCLNVNAFSLTILLSLLLPSLFEREDDQNSNVPLGQALDNYSLRLALVFHLVQLLLTLPCDLGMIEDSSPQAPLTDEEEAEEASLESFYQNVAAGVGSKPQQFPMGWLRRRIRSGFLPFLRCCAIYYRFVTDVTPPSKLKRPSLSDDSEFEALCQYLGLPPYLHETIDSSSWLHQLARDWVDHQEIVQCLKTSPTLSNQVLVPQPVAINKLIPLPEDYSDLINQASIFTCPKNSEDECRFPTICLVCGEMLCSQSYCCQHNLPVGGELAGACTYHSFTCGGGVGLFLRIRDCKVLLLAGKTKGCYLPPPYVDEYGETDQGLLRGNPLHLSLEHYTTLHRLWLNHELAETIVREMEQSNNLSSTNWQLL